MEEICTGCNLAKYEIIQRFFEENHKSLDFLRLHGVLPRTVDCLKCGHACTYNPERQSWQCNQKISVPEKEEKRRACGYVVSDYKGTILENCEFPAWILLLFINLSLKKHFPQSEVDENLELSPETSEKWRSFCSKVKNKINKDGKDPKVRLHQFLLEVARLYPPGPPPASASDSDPGDRD